MKGRRLVIATVLALSLGVGVVPAASQQRRPEICPAESKTPVILVHGISGSSEGFSALVDALGPLADAVCVDRFEYKYSSLNWVTDPRIGELLAKEILLQASLSPSGQAIVVAHSMGGLAARFAANQPDGQGGRVGDHVGLVITIGTPNLGMSHFSKTMIDRAEFTTHLPTRACGPEPDAPIPFEKTDCYLYSLGNSEAGMAMRPVGDPRSRVAELPHFPATIPVIAYAGDITVHGSEFFHEQSFSIGDGVVDVKSAAAEAGRGPEGSRVDVAVHCDIQQRPLIMILSAINELFNLPCFHLSLLGNQIIQRRVLADLSSWLDEQIVATPEEAALLLVDAWERGDEDAALAVSTPAAVAFLFAVQGSSGALEFLVCSDEFSDHGGYDCEFADNHYSFGTPAVDFFVESDPSTGWRVVAVNSVGYLGEYLPDLNSPPVTGPQTPNQAARDLYRAWKRGDRSSAQAVASAKVVTYMFGVSPSTPGYYADDVLQGCDQGLNQYICFFYHGDQVDLVLWVRVHGSSYLVVSAYFAGSD